MSAVPLPLKFQVGARTLASISRQLARVPLSLDDVLAGRLAQLPPLEREAHGYQVTSLPEERLSAMITAAGALRIFSPLVPLESAASLSFCSWLRSQTKRAACWLAEVGPIFTRS